MKRKTFFSFILFLIHTLIKAQTNAIFTNDAVNNQVIFPSQNIATNGIGLLTSFKNIVISGNKTTLKLAAANFSLSQNRAKIGLYYLNYQQNIISQNTLGLNFTYKINLWKGQLASCIGYDIQNYQFQNINILDLDDVNIPFQKQSMYWKSSLIYSFSYLYNDLSIAVSGIQHLSNYQDIAPINTQNQLYSFVSYKFRKNTNIFEPLILVRYLAKDFYINDYMAYWSHNGVFKFGIGYRTNQTIITNIDLSLNKLSNKIPENLSIAYAFDYAFGNSNSLVANELMIKYVISNDGLFRNPQNIKPYKSPVFF